VVAGESALPTKFAVELAVYGRLRIPVKVAGFALLICCHWIVMPKLSVCDPFTHCRLSTSAKLLGVVS